MRKRILIAALLAALGLFLFATLSRNHDLAAPQSGLAPSTAFPGTVGSLSFNSANGAMQLILEAKLNAARGGLETPMTASMKDLKTEKILWRRDFSGDDLAMMRSPPVVSDDGSFFVIKRDEWVSPQWILITREIVKPIASINREALSYFETEERKLFHFDEVAGAKILASWDRDAELWTAFSISDGAKIDVTGELIRKWNEAVRARIFAKIEKARSKALTKKLDTVSPVLGEFAGSMLAGTDSLMAIDLEFLALSRDPRDRPFFQRLLDPRDVNSSLLAMVPKDPYFLSWGREFRITNEVASFQFTDPDLLAADFYLAVFDQKVQKRGGFFRGRDRGLSSHSSVYMDREPRRYLGEVEGTIKFPTPLKKPLGTFRIYLTSDTSSGWENRRETLKIKQGGQSEMTELQDKSKFMFSTVPPGKYFTKVIWDRRSPFTDAAKAGPGDYESDFAGPFEVSAGTVITNIALQCVKRGEGGSDYYQADEAATQLWDRSEISARTFSGTELFSKAAREWIVRTNNAGPGGRGWINSIALLKGYQTRQFERAWPDPLVVSARNGDAKGNNELRRLEIRDEHGCIFKAKESADTGRSLEFTFDSFPRSAGQFRVVGFDDVGRELIDLTLTNLVKVAAKVPATAPDLPMEVDIGPVRLRVKGAYPAMGWGRAYANTDLSFIDMENGQVTTNWFVMDCRFADQHGNEMPPQDFCREEKSVRITGKIIRRPEPKKRSPEDAIQRMMRPPSLEGTNFEFTIPRDAVGPLQQ